MKRYMIVLEQVQENNKRVVFILESDPIDENNMWPVMRGLSKQWWVNSRKYPHPKYDIILGAWEDLKKAEQSVGVSDGWDSAPVETLAVKV